MIKSLARADRLALSSLVCTVAMLTLALRTLAVDDAFVTYRYAFNLAHQQGYVYNSGQATLSTTAPAYGAVLAFFAWLGLDIPTVSNVVSAACIGAGGWLLYVIARRHGRVRLGWIAAMLYVLDPLLWLSLGMETNLQLALVVAAFAAAEHEAPGLAGLTLGAAFVTRYDAALPAAIIFLRQGLHSRRSAVKMAIAGMLVAAPVVVWLFLMYGSPLPVTLLAKRAQNVLGVTGFYAGTGFVEGIAILLRGWLEQTRLYLLSGIAAPVGLALAWRRERWVLPFLLWACIHIVAYIFLGSAPYYWYYAPLVPAVALLIAVAVDWALEIRDTRTEIGGNFRFWIFDWRLRSDLKSVVSSLLVVLCFTPYAYSLVLIWQAQTGPLPDSTTDASKVLPEAKVDVYRQVGEWVTANTPATATLGATEIGVIGYYAQRDVVDFLGLLQPDVANALAGGDPAWALFAYQPDYLALNAVNPIYSFDPRGDDWFRAAYRPLQRFDDERFWGSPMVIYRRETPRVTAEASPGRDATYVNADFGTDIRLAAVEPSDQELSPGKPLAVRLWWGSVPPKREYGLSVQLVGQNEVVIAQRETQLATRGGATPHQTALIGLPETTCAPDIAQLNIVLYDAKTGMRLAVTDAGGNEVGDSLRVGHWSIQRQTDGGNPVDVSFGRALSLVGFDLSPRAVAPGESMRLGLSWRKGEEWREGLSVFVHLLRDDGRIAAQADGAPTFPGEDIRVLTVPADADWGVYRVLVGVYDRARGTRLPWLDAVSQPQGDSLPLCPVRVR